jgi:hypothetical protein
VQVAQVVLVPGAPEILTAVLPASDSPKAVALPADSLARRVAADSNLVWEQQASRAPADVRPQQALRSQAPQKSDVVEQQAKLLAIAQRQKLRQKLRALVVAPAVSQQKQRQAFVLEPKEQADAPPVWLQSDSA